MTFDHLSPRTRRRLARSPYAPIEGEPMSTTPERLLSRPQLLLEHAERVKAIVLEEERQAALLAAHPRAKHAAQAAKFERRERRRLLEEMAATLPADLDGGEAA